MSSNKPGVRSDNNLYPDREVAYPGVTVTGLPVGLTVVSVQATVSIIPSPLSGTLPDGAITGTTTVTVINTAPAGTGS